MDKQQIENKQQKQEQVTQKIQQVKQAVSPQNQTYNQYNLSIYDGLISRAVNMARVKSNKIIIPEQVVLENDVDAKVNALKYRYPLKYLGNQYQHVVVPCTPAYQISLHTIKQTQRSVELDQYLCFVKVPTQTNETVKGVASGKRSAIYYQDYGKLLRFKGCGNQYKGFNRQNNQSRGHHFYHTAKRQLYMTQHINKIFQARLGINPPANKPLYAFNYLPEEISKAKIVNELPLISKYCCVFQTQGDRRAGTHLISPLQILFLQLIDHTSTGLKPVFDAKSRIDNNQLVQLVANYELFLDSNSKFLDVYDASKEITNYINFSDATFNIIQNYDQRLQLIVDKLIPIQQYHDRVLHLLRGVPMQKLVKSVQTILRRIGFEMGQTKRVMCQNEISWGFYLDHGVQWHCNAHLNNYIVTPPQSTQHSKNFFLLPLDYDLSYTSEQFICIDLDSPHYGTFNDQVFQNYLCGQFCAMEMSLFGLELMNFKYGIDESNQNNQERKMSKIAYRDTLVNAFNAGMRNKIELNQQIYASWDENIETIQKLVEACLYLSIQFQT